MTTGKKKKGMDEWVRSAVADEFVAMPFFPFLPVTN